MKLTCQTTVAQVFNFWSGVALIQTGLFESRPLALGRKLFNSPLDHLSYMLSVYSHPGLLLLTKVKLGLSVGVLAKLLILTLTL